jgi:hypothetical protein
MFSQLLYMLLKITSFFRWSLKIKKNHESSFLSAGLKLCAIYLSCPVSGCIQHAVGCSLSAGAKAAQVFLCLPHI